MRLYKIVNGLGDYWVVAVHPKEAEEKVEKFLNDADYGSHSDRVTKQIWIIAEDATDLRFATDKRLVL